jgi:hypothetical protein
LLCLRSVVALGRQICGSSSSYRHNSFPRHLHHRFANSLNHLYGPRPHLCLRSLRFSRNQAAEGKGSAMRRVMVQGLARFSSSSSSSSRYYTHASACLAAAETSTDKSATSGGAAGHVETIIFPRSVVHCLTMDGGRERVSPGLLCNEGSIVKGWLTAFCCLCL